MNPAAVWNAARSACVRWVWTVTTRRCPCLRRRLPVTPPVHDDNVLPFPRVAP